MNYRGSQSAAHAEMLGATQTVSAVGNVSNFAVLGDRPFRSGDLDGELAIQGDSSARKACAALNVASSIMNAVVVHPGSEASDESIACATQELVSRAAEITEAATVLLGLDKLQAGYASYRLVLRQHAAQLVASQWRMAHAAQAKTLTTQQVVTALEAALPTAMAVVDGALTESIDVDPVTAKRVALLAAVPDIHEAVNAFDYFAPDPQVLVERGLCAVMAAAEDGVRRLAGARLSETARVALSQSIISKAGALYATTYRAAAIRDVAVLRAMDPIERQRLVYCAQLEHAGLSTQHIDRAFTQFMDRMVDMVCEAIPASETAIRPLATGHKAAQTNQENPHDAQPD